MWVKDINVKKLNSKVLMLLSKMFFIGRTGVALKKLSKNDPLVDLLWTGYILMCYILITFPN